MSTSPIPLDLQACAVEQAACNQRSAVDRHEDWATRGKWNPELIPSERSFVEQLDAAARTMSFIAKHPEVADMLRQEIGRLAKAERAA